MENNNTVSEKRIIAGSISIVAAILSLTIGCWNEYAWYETVAPLGTLVSFVFLGITFLCWVDLKKAFRDTLFWAVVLGCILAGVNLLVIGSNKGAVLTACDFLLMLYLFDKQVIPKKILYPLTAYIAFYFFYWTIDVKGYFKGYNTNYGGLVLVTGFVFAMAGFFLVRDFLIKKGKIIPARIMYAPILFMFAWGYNIIAWYRARCALLGFLVFVLLILIPAKVWTGRVIYEILTWGMTLGAVIVSILYVGLGKLNDVFTIRIFYKDIISGREEIWRELWGAFLKKPFTGIGSSYVMQIPWMEGMFEVHNGLLDILFVHGTVVFVIVLVLIIGRLRGLRNYVSKSMPRKCAMAGIFAILASSFLENFVIVPPFLLCFLVLPSLIREE